jgi:hypothetical protein
MKLLKDQFDEQSQPINSRMKIGGNNKGGVDPGFKTVGSFGS